MMDVVGLFLSIFSRQVWQLDISDDDSDQPRSKLQCVRFHLLTISSDKKENRLLTLCTLSVRRD